MRFFRKGPEPRALSLYRRQQIPAPTYDDWSQATGKGDGQLALCRDQGYLCAYCMGRIEPDGDDMTIEHYCSQGHFPAQQLDWRNMLGVCPGYHPLGNHCDSSRADEQSHPLPRGEFRVFDPLEDARHAETLITYTATGQIMLDDRSPLVQQRCEDIEYDLFTMINLNGEALRDRRSAVLRTLRQQVARLEREDRGFSQAHRERLIREWSEPADGRHRPYFMVALDWLRRHPPRR
jgi:uncharacterized protein (TIGR02646 family)